MIIIKKFLYSVVVFIVILSGCTEKPVDLQTNIEIVNPDTLKTSAQEPFQKIDSGLLLGFTSFEEDESGIDDDPKPLTGKYKTIWIAQIDTSLKYFEKDGLIVAPGLDGFYEYKNENISKNKEYEETNDDSYPEFYDIEINKFVSYKTGQKYITPEIDLTDNELVYYSEGDNLLFVGNNYAIVNTNRIYTTGAGGFQYFPSIDISKHGELPKSWFETGFDVEKDSGIELKDLFDVKAKINIDNQINKYKKEFDKTVNVESDNDRQYVSEDNLFLERREGSWRLVVPIMFSNWKDSHNYISSVEEIKINIPPSIVSHDTLCFSWANLKRLEPDLIDAVSSPDKKIIVIQTSKALKIYRDFQNDISKPEMVIPLNSNNRIILNQWATGKYVQKWDKELSAILR